jgi:hypothetical protein
MGPEPRNSAEEGALASLAYEWDNGNSFSEFRMAFGPQAMEQQVGLERSELVWKKKPASTIQERNQSSGVPWPRLCVAM